MASKLIEEQLKKYIDITASETLDTPAKGHKVLRWTLHRELSQEERNSLYQELLPHIRQCACAIYYKGEHAQAIRRIVADLDGCLVAEELLVHVAQSRGEGSVIAEATQQAMQGEIDFARSFSERVRILKGMTASQLEEIAQSIRLAQGVESFCRFTEGEDIRLDLASSNLTPYVHTLMLRLGANDYIATMPSMDSVEVLDGTLVEPIITAEHKRDYCLSEVSKRISIEQTLTIGDGANDLLMLACTPHALLYHSAGEESLNIADIMIDLYFRP